MVVQVAKESGAVLLLSTTLQAISWPSDSVLLDGSGSSDNQRIIKYCWELVKYVISCTHVFWISCI